MLLGRRACWLWVQRGRALVIAVLGLGVVRIAVLEIGIGIASLKVLRRWRWMLEVPQTRGRLVAPVL